MNLRHLRRRSDVTTHTEATLTPKGEVLHFTLISPQAIRLKDQESSFNVFKVKKNLPGDMATKARQLKVSYRENLGFLTMAKDPV